MFDLLSFLAIVLLVIIVVMLVDTYHNNDDSSNNGYNNRKPDHPHKQLVPTKLSSLYYHRPHQKHGPESYNNNGWWSQSDQYSASLNNS